MPNSHSSKQIISAAYALRSYVPLSVLLQATIYDILDYSVQWDRGVAVRIAGSLYEIPLELHKKLLLALVSALPARIRQTSDETWILDQAVFLDERGLPITTDAVLRCASRPRDDSIA
jgi:hypothetical protein